MLDDASFKDMVHAIRASAHVPKKQDSVTTMRTVKKAMMEKVARMMKGEHVCITSDGWTSCANDTYMSLTVTLITSAWKLVTLSVDCSKSEGTTTGDALAAGIKAAVAKHGLAGKITAITTDCEPSMVKMGRLLEEDDVCTHIGCCNHRLESTTSIVFNGPGVKKVMALARGVVTRYSTSSQAADRLAQFVKTYLGSEKKRVIQDVATRWWSTCSMVGRLLELKVAIDKHEEADKLDPLLTAADWAVLELILPILEPFRHTQTLLEGRKYVTGSLVVPFIYDLRNSLEDAIDDLNELQPSSNADVNTARAAVKPCVAALRDDFINRWGDGRDILTYAEGNRRQPRGFKPVQVLATALDPRTKILWGAEENEKAGVWKLVQEEAVKIAVQNRTETNFQGASSQQRPEASAAAATLTTGAGEEDSSRKRPRRGGGGFMAAAQAVGDAPVQQVGEGADSSTTSLITNSVRVELEAFQASSGIKMYELDKEGTRVYLDPLDWWRVRRTDFPHLANLARRVLAIPATQAESERLFSCAGNIVTKNRNKLAPPTVELLVLLRHSWKIVEEWEASNNAAARAAKRG